MAAIDKAIRVMRQALALRGAPFMVALLGAFALLEWQPDVARPGQLLLAAALAALIVVALAAVPWPQLSGPTQFLVPLAVLVLVALLRHNDGGGHSAFTPLILLPVLWAAVHARRSVLAMTVVGVAVALVAPLVVAGAPAYPSSETTAVIIWVVVALATALATRGLHERACSFEADSRSDTLTRLPNRRAWDTYLPIELARARRGRQPLSIAMLDLDHFKAYNDTHGHQAGDRLLENVTRAWRQELRSTDLLVRWGGEEFAAIFQGCAIGEAASLARRLASVVPDGCTVSIGVACWDRKESGGELVTRADKALYVAKESGRDRVVSAPPASADSSRVLALPRLGARASGAQNSADVETNPASASGSR